MDFNERLKNIRSKNNIKEHNMLQHKQIYDSTEVDRNIKVLEKLVDVENNITKELDEKDEELIKNLDEFYKKNYDKINTQHAKMKELSNNLTKSRDNNLVKLEGKKKVLEKLDNNDFNEVNTKLRDIKTMIDELDFLVKFTGVHS